MNDAELESARQELFAAGVHFTRNWDEKADEDYMAGVIARLEVAAERFVEAKINP